MVFIFMRWNIVEGHVLNDIAIFAKVFDNADPLEIYKYITFRSSERLPNTEE